MGLFNIEKNMMDTMRKRLTFKTEIEDTDDKLVMINITLFDGKEIYRHEYDLEPLIQAIKKRI